MKPRRHLEPAGRNPADATRASAPLPGEGDSAAMIPPTALARAERALAGMEKAYAHLLKDELKWLRRDVAALRRDPQDRPLQQSILARTHEIRNLAGSYGYTWVSRIGTSLCRLLQTARNLEPSEAELIELHVDSMIEACRQQIGNHLVQALERSVDLILAIQNGAEAAAES